MNDVKKQILVIVEGESNARIVPIRPEATVGELLETVILTASRPDLVEVLIEDEDSPLAADKAVGDLSVANKILHAASNGTIKVTVEYGQAHVSSKFRPNTTMDTIIRWAIQPGELNVQAPIEDLQLKHGNDVLPGDFHLGQVTRGHKEIKFSLVFKVKPQG